MEAKLNNYHDWIGKKVKKISGRPFKSHSKTNTVRDIGLHLVLSQKRGEPVPCFVFEEDNSYVACSACELSDPKDIREFAQKGMDESLDKILLSTKALIALLENKGS